MRAYLGDNTAEIRNLDIYCGDESIELAASYEGDESNDLEIYFDKIDDLIEFCKFIYYFTQKCDNGRNRVF